jgi:hypothetical protein
VTCDFIGSLLRFQMELETKLTVLSSDWPGLLLELCGSLLVTWSHVAYSCFCLSSINNALTSSVKIIGITCQNLSLQDGWIVLKHGFGDIDKWRSLDFSGSEMSAVRPQWHKSGVLLHVTRKWQISSYIYVGRHGLGSDLRPNGFRLNCENYHTPEQFITTRAKNSWVAFLH